MPFIFPWWYIGHGKTNSRSRFKCKRIESFCRVIGLYWNIGMTCFPMKCFTLPLKLLWFPPLGVPIPVRPNRRKCRHTVCTDKQGGHYISKCCIAGGPDKVSRQNTSHSMGTSCSIANRVTSQEAYFAPVSMTTVFVQIDIVDVRDLIHGPLLPTRAMSYSGH